MTLPDEGDGAVRSGPGYTLRWRIQLSVAVLPPPPAMERPTISSSSDEPPSKRVKMSAPPLGDFSLETGLFGTLVASLGQRACNEPEVGVTEFVEGNIASFQGIIKHRFTDFLVYEIGADGEVVRLRDMRQPSHYSSKKKGDAAGQEVKEEVKEMGAAEVGETKAEAPVAEAEKENPKEKELWNDDTPFVMAPFLSPEQIEAFKTFLLAGPPPRNQPKTVPKPTFTTPIIDEKEKRTAFHRALREHFDSKFISEAREIKEKAAEGEEAPKANQVIDVVWKPIGKKDERVSKADRRQKNQQANAGNVVYPPYIHFTVQKTNKEQHDALKSIGRLLHLQDRDLGTTGTKDKRAVTVQRISVRRGNKTIEEVWRTLTGVATGFRGRGRGRGRGGFGGTGMGLDRGIRVGDFEYQDRPLSLGGAGNRFVITLRDVQVDSPATIDSSLTSLSKHGFINYYGMQRFGTAPVPTHAIGLALFRSDWELAVHLILREREGENDESKLARLQWEEGKIEEAARTMPKRCVAEKAILDHFAQTKNTTDCLSALSRIPKNLRMMYVHAWQSYIWNRVTSERIALFGAKKPVVGDLVYEEDETAEEVEVAVDEVASVVESLEPNLDDDDPSVSVPITTVGEAMRQSKVAKAKALTQADIDSGKYTIFDVVLPMPGYAVVYPTGQLGETYKEIMRSDKIDPDDMYRKQKEYSLGGTYRKILHLPSDVVHKLFVYSLPTEDLAQSDEDRLLNRPPPTGIPYDAATFPLPLPAGKSLALQVELTLGSSTYATMALREVLKTRTSGAHQKALTEQMEGKFVDASSHDA